MIIVIAIAGLLMAVGAVGAIWRIIKGPSALDRIIASDVLVATVMCALGAEMAVNGHTDTLPVMLGLALFGIVGSVSVARFISSRDDT
ncbi:monovalent cation/H+ antiporter complex subunit F [Herbiconiux sp. CPCC 203407]|uniref:Monovalent cation/H+ antiporter complex subunit F n=1 Tax=Herbiconiux oxytropis TaxID=2970915 RepID=A0AA42BSJ0_9MICO|nr:monovalent cation/H+ antiporter complex subunit F [Herbiconiux oxytropis]MCS5723113.1 monovalent cation/H+ antiporter complex subunit F [Herbiconiux oxytropis]MCS5725330.1 monovalent cation/H+ antiporter complex subunit F [Herbiconiux oxytropis]